MFLIQSVQFVYLSKQCFKASSKYSNLTDGYKALMSTEKRTILSQSQSHSSFTAFFFTLSKCTRKSVISLMYSKCPYNLDKGVSKCSSHIWILLNWHEAIPTTNLEGILVETSSGGITSNSALGSICALYRGYTYGVRCLANNSVLLIILVNLMDLSLFLSFPLTPPARRPITETNSSLLINFSV